MFALDTPFITRDDLDNEVQHLVVLIPGALKLVHSYTHAAYPGNDYANASSSELLLTCDTMQTDTR